MAFPVFLDTCALFGQCLCDALLSIAEQGAFTPYWSARVLAAVERCVVEAGHAKPEAIRARVRAMNRAFPTAEVTGFEHLIPAMTNNAGDHHVLAACVASPAQTLITFNIKDFPADSLAPYEIEVVHPDDFLLDQLDLHPELVMQGITGMLRRNALPPRDVVTLADYLTRCDVPKFAQALLDLPQRIPTPD